MTKTIYEISYYKSAHDSGFVRYVTSKRKAIKYLVEVTGVPYSKFKLYNMRNPYQRRFEETAGNYKNLWKYNIHDVILSYPNQWGYKIWGEKACEATICELNLH